LARAACRTRESIAADFQRVAKDPIIAQRLGDTGQIMSVLGPAEFGARVQEQRDKLAALAKTLGLKAAQ
jgi:tripartite-type tricarboxylate transporter receptor subunit TctC